MCLQNYDLYFILYILYFVVYNLYSKIYSLQFILIYIGFFVFLIVWVYIFVLEKSIMNLQIQTWKHLLHLCTIHDFWPKYNSAEILHIIEVFNHMWCLKYIVYFRNTHILHFSHMHITHCRSRIWFDISTQADDIRTQPDAQKHNL